MLRFLILALCLAAVLVPLLPVVAIALVFGALAVATRRIDETRVDLQHIALLAVTPLRAPPAASLR